MAFPETEMDKISFQLSEDAQRFAEKASKLACDPYFRQAVMKSAVSAFVWQLFHAFDDDFGREALLNELIEQTAAVGRAVDPENFKDG